MRLILGAALLTASVLTTPSAAAAVAPDMAELAALTERAADGKSVSYPVRRGESVPVVLGVANVGTEPVDGVVVQLRVVNDVDLPAEFTNCAYYADGNLEGAWCSLGGQVTPGETYALEPFHVAAAPKAQTSHWSTVIFRWYSRAWAAEQGGIDALAKAHSGTKQASARGGARAVALLPKDLPIPAQTAPIGFGSLRLVEPSNSASPPDPAPVTTASTSASAPAAGGQAGGLAITGPGAATAVAVGAGLLISGVAGVVLVRRRRARFTA